MKSIIGKVIFVFTVAVFIFAGCKNEVEKEVEKLDYAPPEQIKNVNATVGNSTVLLSWTNSSDEDFYGTKISFTPASMFVSQPVIIEGEAGKNSSTIFNGLDNGVEYTFNLVALDKRQNKAERVIKTASPVDDGDYTAPNEVSNFKTTVGNSSIILSWQNPSDSDFYAVEISSTPAEGTLSQNVILTDNPSKKMTFTVANLENAKNYNFTIKTIDKALNKSAGVKKTASPVDDGDYTAPNEVLDFTTTVGNSSVILSWQNPSDSDFYAVEISSTPAEGTLAQNVILTGAPSQKMTFTVTSLENAKNYNFTIKTIDKALNKSAGVLETASPVDDGDYTPPANVTNLEAKNKGNSILITWTDATDSDIFGYEVSYMVNDGSRAAFSAPIAENVVMVAQGTEQCLVRNLTNEVEYIFTIKSVDTSGNKSEGATITATPHESKLSIDISLPNDDGEKIVLTNDKAPVTVKFSSTDSIEKAVWKKGAKDVVVKPENLITDESANVLELNSENVAGFNVTENGWYDIAVKDVAGRYEWEQVEIKTIDMTPLEDLKNLKTESDGENIILTWNDSVHINEYDSPLKTITLSYIYNDDENDLDNGTVKINVGNQKAFIPIAVGKTKGSYMHITVQTVDELGNISDGITIMAWCSKTIIADKDDVIEKISSMTENGQVIIKDRYSDALISNIIKAFQLKNDESILVDLDLSNVTGMNSIGGFADCKCLSSIEIPDGVISIRYYAFCRCSSLTSIEIPDSVISIGNDAFSGCTSLRNIEIPASVTSIDSWAFYECSSLTSIEIPGNVTSIGEYVFRDCTGLTSIEIPDSVTRMKKGAFYNCRSLISVKISACITRIEEFTFCDCSSLTSIEIPSSVTSIGNWAFERVNASKMNIRFKGTLTEWLLKSWNLFSVFRNYDLYINDEKITRIKIPDWVTSIESSAFGRCSSLTSIEIPDSVTSIEDNAFNGCTSLTSIEVPDSVTRIEDNAFNGCTSLTSIEIPDSVTSLGSRAFYGCTSLTSIEIPDSVTSIGGYTFYGCTSLTSIEIPDSVTSIGWYAFEGCTSLASIEIPDSVISIGWYAFNGCTGLTNIEIPAGVTSIGCGAFCKCSALVDITFIDTESLWFNKETGNLVGNAGELRPFLITDFNSNFILEKTQAE
ncbi:MAG: leucine-rich repeat protein [Treponema sp.]|nr:leucine-rich repeat protein [Treponema sp.]